MPNPDELLTFDGLSPEVELRDESRREIGIRIMEWGQVGKTEEGLEVFERGAFQGTNPQDVILRMEHEGPPIGIGVKIEERDKDAIGVFRVASTSRGDEALTLVKEGLYKGSSPMFRRDNHVTTYERTADGQRLARRKRVDMREVSLTWRPTYQGTGPMYVRSQEDGSVADTSQPDVEVPAPVGSASPDINVLEKLREFTQPISDRLEALEARSETVTGAVLPDVSDEPATPYRGKWMKTALTLMDGGDVPAHEMRALADNIAADNPGFIPTVYSNELIGIIDPARPFMQSTRRIDMPENGLTISYPRITQRPSVGEQTVEKTEVSSRAVETDRLTADVRTFAGAGDISLQILRRSDPSFLNAYLELLGEQYAVVTENAAVDALLAASPTAGTGTFDPTDLDLSEGFENGAAVGRSLIPDTIWMSTTAISEFMKAKSPSGGGGTPLYPGLAGISGVTGEAGQGRRMTLNPVWVPALDDETVDIVIGPSRGFAWGEEGTFTLQADVPGRLGRDVALAGFVVFVPLYPAAFTTYVVATA